MGELGEVKAKRRNNLITWSSGRKSVWLTNASRRVAENEWINFTFGWQSRWGWDSSRRLWNENLTRP